MTVAGSDSGGGAGIQADLKTFAAFGVYGASVVTALTAQNTCQVAGVHPSPPDFVALQIETVLSDIPVKAVKTGMLYSAEIIEAVCEALTKNRAQNLVVDPVMIAKSGDSLLKPTAVAALKTRLIPMALVATPNIPEAEALTGIKINSVDEMKLSARKIVKMGADNVVIKGGHMRGDKLTDILLADGWFTEFKRRRIDTQHTHGTGCTFSSAITAGLAKGLTVLDSVEAAERYIEEAIKNAEPLGKGHGPVNHFWNLKYRKQAQRGN
ncbi:Hydroxymethylpyrimidine phosphate kinase ThiD [hydrothermal vent metagenome]|uniref:Hydroxymethylpyrimidine phosphate kinase ThiD n=1 Tax=hydrothermal vent metagenome TaxID=652676 RepID=A0A3B1DB00_9ZZZZ